MPRRFRWGTGPRNQVHLQATEHPKAWHGVLEAKAALLLLVELRRDLQYRPHRTALPMDPVQIMTAALEARQPCLFFCKLGKDRTGLMAALVLSVCGATEEEIVADYTRWGNHSQLASTLGSGVSFFCCNFLNYTAGLGSWFTAAFGSSCVMCIGSNPASHLPCFSLPSCRSAGVQQVALGGLEKQGELKGMDESVFSAAPPEAMRGLLLVGAGLAG